MLDFAPSDHAQTLEITEWKASGRKAENRAAMQPIKVLRSRVRGRERWYVDGLEDHPRLAAAIELVLRSEEGIEEVCANPLTGRVLVRYRPDSVSESVETMLGRAIEAGPMSREEFAALRPELPRSSFSGQLVTAEIACCLSHIVVFGGLCPIGLAATGVLLLLHRSAAHTHA
jgi:hypothetical protein